MTKKMSETLNGKCLQGKITAIVNGKAIVSVFGTREVTITFPANRLTLLNENVSMVFLNGRVYVTKFDKHKLSL